MLSVYVCVQHFWGGFLIFYSIYIQTATLDDASRRREKEESSNGFVELKCPANKEKRWIGKNVNTCVTTEHGRRLHPKIVALPILWLKQCLQHQPQVLNVFDTFFNFYETNFSINRKNIYAGINYSEMEQITPIILDKENIPPDAHGEHSHVALGTATTDTCILRVY
jgi:hypothetical protein